jgi:hypothetical protein
MATFGDLCQSKRRAKITAEDERVGRRRLSQHLFQFPNIVVNVG